MTEINMTRNHTELRVTLGTTLSAAEVPELQAALKREIDAGARELVFDLHQTTALDSTGIGLLVAVSNSMAAVEGQQRLIHVSDDLFKLLRSMRLVDRLQATTAA